MSKRQKFEVVFDETSRESLADWLIAQCKYFDEESRMRFAKCIQETGKAIELYDSAIQEKINNSFVRMKITKKAL